MIVDWLFIVLVGYASFLAGLLVFLLVMWGVDEWSAWRVERRPRIRRRRYGREDR